MRSIPPFENDIHLITGSRSRWALKSSTIFSLSRGGMSWCCRLSGRVIDFRRVHGAFKGPQSERFRVLGVELVGARPGMKCSVDAGACGHGLRSGRFCIIDGLRPSSASDPGPRNNLSASCARNLWWTEIVTCRTRRDFRSGLVVELWVPRSKVNLVVEGGRGRGCPCLARPLLKGIDPGSGGDSKVVCVLSGRAKPWKFGQTAGLKMELNRAVSAAEAGSSGPAEARPPYWHSRQKI